jgi:hypothetical protein
VRFGLLAISSGSWFVVLEPLLLLWFVVHPVPPPSIQHAAVYTPQSKRQLRRLTGRKVSTSQFKKITAIGVGSRLLLLLLLWIYGPLLCLGRFFSFLILCTVGRTPWTGDQPVAKHLPIRRTTQTQNKRTQYTDIHALSGIRTHDLSVRTNKDSSCLRPRGHCDRRR